jgi:hypothetical protein
MSLEDKLDHYFECGLNCLLRGDHGVGKTTLVNDCFGRHGLVVGETALILSAATIDPWVDFIGVPKEVTKDNETYLDFILPKHFANDTVQAIFFDEFNRSHKKIRNAVLELIQFKSINGRKFNNLKVVWAAINPEDSESFEYDVEKLDPAQKDRFQIILDVPYLPSYAYFSNKYGEKPAAAAIDWWKELPAEMQKQVSPRRLDYALEVHGLNGDLSDVLPYESSPRRLGRTLMHGSPNQIFANLLNSNKEEELSDFLNDSNNIDACMPEIIKYKKHMKKCLPLIREESLVSTIFKHNEAKKHIESLLLSAKDHEDPSTSPDKKEISKYVQVLDGVSRSDTDKAMSSWAYETLGECIPGFMLVTGPKLTLHQLEKNVIERYDINVPKSHYSYRKQDVVNYEASQELINIKQRLRDEKQTIDKIEMLHNASHLVKSNHEDIENYDTVLDIVDLFCERSQKKTVVTKDVTEDILFLGSWGIDSFAQANDVSEEKKIKTLIRKIPHALTKCLISEIEDSKNGFSIFMLKDQARIFQELMK